VQLIYIKEYGITIDKQLNSKELTIMGVKIRQDRNIIYFTYNGTTRTTDTSDLENRIKSSNNSENNTKRVFPTNNKPFKK
jgi:hypothetical protein